MGNASVVGTACTCNTGFYASNSKCVKCPVGCTACSSATLCSACVDSVNTNNVTTRDVPTKTCACLTGFYEVNNTVCPACDLSCKTCSMIPTNCTSCNTDGNFVQ